jgi:NAD(P)-dependent dehydrogenase (short-subunit alcohol dehydrogenase family)
VKTFLITGVSQGLGRAFAEAALGAGHTVVGTVRRAEQVDEFEALAPGLATAKVLDVTDFDAVATLSGEKVDVLIANAGYGHEGTFEESTMAELKRQFDVNVFGAVAVMKAVLPGMRERRQGHIFVITSMGGRVTFPGLSYYHGSKFAMEGIVAALAQEVAQFGVHVVAVEPGSFRTSWAGGSMVRAPRSIPDYDALMDPMRERRLNNSGKQLGDPVKAAAAILEVIDADRPPVHLVLGSDALRLVAAGRAQVDQEIADWAGLSASTDFPEGAVLG